MWKVVWAWRGGRGGRCVRGTLWAWFGGDIRGEEGGWEVCKGDGLGVVCRWY